MNLNITDCCRRQSRQMSIHNFQSIRRWYGVEPKQFRRGSHMSTYQLDNKWVKWGVYIV